MRSSSSRSQQGKADSHSGHRLSPESLEKLEALLYLLLQDDSQADPYDAWHLLTRKNQILVKEPEPAMYATQNTSITLKRYRTASALKKDLDIYRSSTCDGKRAFEIVPKEKGFSLKPADPESYSISFSKRREKWQQYYERPLASEPHVVNWASKGEYLYESGGREICVRVSDHEAPVKQALEKKPWRPRAERTDEIVVPLKELGEAANTMLSLAREAGRDDYCHAQLARMAVRLVEDRRVTAADSIRIGDVVHMVGRRAWANPR